MTVNHVAGGGSVVTQDRLETFLERQRKGYFAPRTWAFWRSLIASFCIFCLVGHLLEIPYCTFMRNFGIVADDYAVWTDPWFHPYWVYGIGAVVMTLVLEPFKERLFDHRKTVWGALLETFVVMVVLAMLMELGIGELVNQPKAAGVYPYWDNSQLPFNILGQAWLVNDLVIGLVAMIYLWVLYPLICEGLARLSRPISNAAFGAIVTGFAACCVASYSILALW
jgi:uncharacterized membrane protein